MSNKSPRGIRNNNPGNIVNTPTHWLGERLRKLDPTFEEFETPVMGLRALAVLLLGYFERKGLDSVSSVIRRFAPPNENNTLAYINAVAHELQVQPDQSIDVRALLPALMQAIIRHENGEQPYSTEQIAEAITLATNT